MPFSNSYVLGLVDAVNVGALYEFIILLLAMVGRYPKSFISPGITVGILGLEVFIQCTLLESWFLRVFGPAYFVLDNRLGIRVRVVFHFLRDSIEVTLLETLRSNFVKRIGFPLDPLELIFQHFSCLLKLLVWKLWLLESQALVELLLSFSSISIVLGKCTYTG